MKWKINGVNKEESTPTNGDTEFSKLIKKQKTLEKEKWVAPKRYALIIIDGQKKKKVPN